MDRGRQPRAIARGALPVIELLRPTLMTVQLLRTAALQSSPPASRREFWLLVGSVLTVFALASLAPLATRRTLSPLHFTDGRLLATLAVEAVLALLWLPYLKRRGWNVDQVTRPLSSGDVVRALGLAVLAYVAYFLTYAVVMLPDVWLALDTVGEPASGAPSVGMVIAVSVLNPLFEECLYLGYVANALRPRGRD